MRMSFTVCSKSSGNEYNIEFVEKKGVITLICDCPAGENGMYCKHRFALIDGKDDEVLRSSHSVADLAKAIEGTRLSEEIDLMHADEKTLKEARATLQKTKKNVAKLMRGADL